MSSEYHPFISEQARIENLTIEEFIHQDVPHKAQRTALADRLAACRDGNGYGGFSWKDRWLAVKEIEDLLLALIDQKLGDGIDSALWHSEPSGKNKSAT